MATKPTPKPKYKLPARSAPPKGFQDPVKKGLEFFFGDKTQPSRKRNAPKPRAVKLPGTPVPMPGYKPRRVPGQALPAPMPTVEGNYGKPRAQQVRPKRIGPAGPKRKSPGVAARPKKKM